MYLFSPHFVWQKKKGMTQRANFGGVLKNPSTVFIAGFFTVLVAQPR